MNYEQMRTLPVAIKARFIQTKVLLRSCVLAIGILLQFGVQSQYTGGIGRGDVMTGLVVIPYVPGIVLQPRFFLEGPYQSVNNLMSDALRMAGLVPLQEPYTEMGYFHVGDGGNEQTTASVLAVTGVNAIVDWVVVELRQLDVNIRVATQSALLQRDGDVVGMDGVSPLQFNVLPGTYYVSVRHRNHLGIITASPLALGGTPLTLDFRSAATSVFGTEARKAIGSARVLWAGDVSFNGQVKYTGAANDRDPILARIGGVVPTNVASGYFPEDVNMDGLVKYSGASNDRDFILENIGGLVPTNTRVGQFP
jgi:hypothetical protein